MANWVTTLKAKLGNHSLWFSFPVQKRTSRNISSLNEKNSLAKAKQCFDFYLLRR